jgi:hypothetical protein
MVQAQFGTLDDQRAALEKAHARSGNTSTGPAAACRGETLHQALDSYIEWIRSDKDTAYSKTRIGQAERLKERHPDVPLASMDFDACEQRVGLPPARSTEGLDPRPRLAAFCTPAVPAAPAGCAAGK